MYMERVGSYQQYSYMPNYQNRTVINSQSVKEEPTVEPEARDLAVKMGLLQLVSMGIRHLSEKASGILMRGQEFTSPQDVKKVAESMVDKNGLNVTVDFINQQNIKNYPKDLYNNLEAVAKGENAFYMDGLKLAVAPEKRPSLILHELGHAINATKGKFMKALQKSRIYAVSAPTALLFLSDVFKHKDGSSNFFERNAGTIGFCAFLPTIIEEGLASFRGIKVAKEVLGKTANLKALKRNYFFAWMTYILSGIGLGIAAKQTVLLNKTDKRA